jgi:y4mF family transcriptional regulator
MSSIADFVRTKRKEADLTQAELASRAGVGLRFIRELENDKKTLRLDKVDQVLQLFGHTVGPIKAPREIEND